MTDEQKASEAARVLGIVNEGSPDEAEKHRRLAELIGHIWDAATAKERYRASQLLWDAAEKASSPIGDALRAARLDLLFRSPRRVLVDPSSAPRSGT